MIYTPPMNISERDMTKKSVFLAGSIEMGNAENWQEDLVRFFYNNCFNVFNPRRSDWDSSWKQDFTNPYFSQQVNWELDALEKSDYIIMYFDPNTKSPISLLELGLFAHTGKLMVICPDGFWRKGNVDIVCNRYNIPMFKNFDQLKNYILLINKKIK